MKCRNGCIPTAVPKSEGTSTEETLHTRILSIRMNPEIDITEKAIQELLTTHDDTDKDIIDT